MLLLGFFDFCIEKTQKIEILVEFLKIIHLGTLLGRFWGYPAAPQHLIFITTKIDRKFNLASMGHFWGTFGHLESLWSLRGWIWEPPGSILEHFWVVFLKN